LILFHNTFPPKLSFFLDYNPGYIPNSVLVIKISLFTITITIMIYKYVKIKTAEEKPAPEWAGKHNIQN
jgi:hypothetical protein